MCQYIYGYYIGSLSEFMKSGMGKNDIQLFAYIITIYTIKYGSERYDCLGNSYSSFFVAKELICTGAHGQKGS